MRWRVGCWGGDAWGGGGAGGGTCAARGAAGGMDGARARGGGGGGTPRLGPPRARPYAKPSCHSPRSTPRGERRPRAPARSGCCQPRPAAGAHPGRASPPPPAPELRPQRPRSPAGGLGPNKLYYTGPYRAWHRLVHSRVGRRGQKVSGGLPGPCLHRDRPRLHSPPRPRCWLLSQPYTRGSNLLVRFSSGGSTTTKRTAGSSVPKSRLRLHKTINVAITKRRLWKTQSPSSTYI